jgi:hypothetical protein
MSLINVYVYIVSFIDASTGAILDLHGKPVTCIKYIHMLFGSLGFTFSLKSDLKAHFYALNSEGATRKKEFLACALFKLDRKGIWYLSDASDYLFQALLREYIIIILSIVLLFKINKIKYNKNIYQISEIFPTCEGFPSTSVQRFEGFIEENRGIVLYRYKHFSISVYLLF